MLENDCNIAYYISIVVVLISPAERPKGFL